MCYLPKIVEPPETGAARTKKPLLLSTLLFPRRSGQLSKLWTRVSQPFQISAMDLLYTAYTNSDKAEMLGYDFSTCFYRIKPPLISNTQSTWLSLPWWSPMHWGTYQSLIIVKSRCIWSYWLWLHLCQDAQSTTGSITEPVTNLLNFSLTSSRIPQEWKSWIVVPIPKSSPAASPDKFRPIFLLCMHAQ